VNPFGNQSSTHSTWPVVMSLYNLPPWLCKKQKYMMLTILVSGPKQPGDHTDVYLRPLVDDLKILWKPGMSEVWDEYKREEFTMHGMLFTTINDNPAHRNLSSRCWMCVIQSTTCTSRRMCVKLLVEHCYNRSPKEKIIKMQGRI
jgi:hypothetical protein